MRGHFFFFKLTPKKSQEIKEERITCPLSPATFDKNDFISRREYWILNALPLRLKAKRSHAEISSNAHKLQASSPDIRQDKC